MKWCYYCHAETQGATIFEYDDESNKEILVDICDECLISHEYNPEDFNNITKGE